MRIRRLTAACLAAFFAGAAGVLAYAQQLGPASGPASANNLGIPIVIPVLAANTAAQNQTIINAAIAAANVAGGNETLTFPAGQFNYAPPLTPITASQVAITCPGKWSTTLFPTAGSTGDSFVWMPPTTGAAGNQYNQGGSFTNCRIYRSPTDNPTAGRALVLDHAANFRYDAWITGGFVQIECNACLSPTLTGTLDGTSGVALSKQLWVHRTITTVTTTGSTASGAVLPVNTVAGLYDGMTVTGSGNIPAGDTIKNYDPIGLTITLNSAITGTVGNSVTLTGTDAQSVNLSVAMNINGDASFAASYDYAVLAQSVDGLRFANAHVGFSTHSSLYVQPQNSTDSLTDITGTPGTYFDTSSQGGGIEFACYGQIAMTGYVTNGSPTLTLNATPPSDLGGYTIVMNGVPNATTVSSGGTTTTPTMSGNANSVAGGVGGGNVWVDFCPAYTGTNATHNIAGTINGGTNSTTSIFGVRLSDPALVDLKLDMKMNGVQQNLLDMRAGTMVNAMGATFYNPNTANGSSASVLMEGDATHLNLSATSFKSGSHAPPYHISKQGQAKYLIVTGADFAGSATEDIIDQSINPALANVASGNSVGECTTDNTALAANTIGCPNLLVVGTGSGANTYVLTPGGLIMVQMVAATASAAWPTLQSTGGGNWDIYGGGAPTTLNISAKVSGSGTVNLGSSISTDVVNISASGKLTTVNGNLATSNAYFTAAAPTVSAGQMGLGSTVAATGNCGTLSGDAGCLVVNVAGTTRYVPYY